MEKVEFWIRLQTGKTGVFFEKQEVEDVKNAILRLETIKFDKNEIRKHAMQFDEEEFRKKIIDFVNDKVKRKQLKTDESCSRCQDV